MGAELLSSRAICGFYYARLDQSVGTGWIDAATNYFTSDQDAETYAWLGMSPQLRLWVGGRQAKGFLENKLTITNLHFESTIEILKKDARRDKTGQIKVRINDLADRTNAHWASLASQLILNGASTVCYDTQYYFSTSHSEGNSGTQSNKLSVTLSGLPCQVHGTAAAPSAEEMQQCILKAIAQIISFKDDQGEPMNENAAEFLVMVPTSLYLVAQAAVNNNVLTSNAINLIPNLQGMTIRVAMNARLNSWTSTFVVFRTDGSVKAIIRQEEAPIALKAKAEGSEFEFDNDAWQFGVDTWRNVGYGYWQMACQVVMA
ncbi:Mu-like prophage major head subunit gpT family protein [Geothrix sp. 21YS21S-2]|uniref:Mu-like prophage major head subunit gpT family protein n=1 Tax=Geothrix sp. 21YS21S-2 TaxID=3068893 RepID=UPI0027BA51B3|nr:Mu-like prophage major head subunit gpT family protein [Geothrix sp. 21YS21S-2]